MRLSRSVKWGLCGAGLCLAFLAPAQTIYRIVGADGKVSFSDQPPTATDKAKVATTNVTGGASASVAGLPFQLRQVVAKYPVTLYTAKDCSPCGSARSLLGSRGIPFAERTVNTPEDFAALKRLAGDNSVPVLTIGSQRLKGFSDVEWNQYLDAAGYPATSMLPAGYRQAAATPLVAVAEAPVAEKAPAKPVDAPPPVQSGPSPSNPAGIQF